METTLSKKIRVRMIMKDVNGAQIARTIGVHRSLINKTINGERKSFRIRKGIADALQLKVSDLWPEKSK